MATIKSYSDLQQSKKLAEFLPLESADMSWVSIGLGKPFARTRPIKGDPEEFCACWSLAALLGVLPTIDDGFEPQLHRSLDKYHCTYEGEEDSSGLWRVADNPVDACVEMILKLHELKML